MRSHAVAIKEVIDRFGCRTALDYGVGKGAQYEWRCADEGHAITKGMGIEEYWGVEVVKYDPAYPKFAEEPEGKFDLVICTHTLGAIPIADLGWVIDRLYGFAEKAIYIGERIGATKKKLFTDPKTHPINWKPERWVRAIRRKETDVKVFVTFRDHTTGNDVKTIRCEL